MALALKEALKNSKSIKKSDEILDDLFNSIKEEKKSSDSDESEIEDESDDSSDTDPDRKKHKKRKKKKKKHKKKKKKHKRSESEEREDYSSKRVKKEIKTEDSFWGDSKPYDESSSRKEVSSRDESRRRERGDSDGRRGEKSEQLESRGRYDRERSGHSDYKGFYESRESRSKPEYNDERKPIDLGRVARPFPTGGEERGRSQTEGRVARPARPYPEGRGAERDYTGYGPSYEERDTGYREAYDREKWVRGEYDRYAGRGERRRKDGREEREEYNRTKDRVKDTERRRENEPEKGGDRFWDTKWEGMQLDEKLEKAEAKGRYYLNTKKRFQDATGDKEGTPSLSPSPDRDGKKKKNKSDSESDSEELVRLKKLRDIQNLKVDGDGMVAGPIADSANYEYDKVTRMFKKKDGLVQLEKKKLDGKIDKPVERLAITDESKNEDKENDDGIMDELVKEIEELENEVDSKDADEAFWAEKPTASIDWSDSALAHLKEDEKIGDKKKIKKDLEDGEVEEDKEDGEVNSDEEKRKARPIRSKHKSRSKSKRRSYSRGKDRSTYDRSSRRRSRSHNRDAYSRGRHYSRDRGRSRSPYDRYSRKRYERSRSYERRGYSRRSRTRERSAENRYERNIKRQEKHLRSKINKTKLLEIAKKNAAKILKSGGDLMGMDQDRLISMKSGGSSLDELTKFCKEIAKKGLEDSKKIDLLAESESSSDDEFHHPFMVKDRPLPNPITMLIGEARETLPPAARAVAKSQRMLEFPVSSGNAHRSKEEILAAEGKDPLGDWQPVAKKAIEMKVDEDEMIKFHEQIEKEEKELLEATKAKMKEAEEETEPSKPWKLSEEDKDIAFPKSSMFTAPIKELSPAVEKELEKLKPKSAILALTTAKAPLAIAAPVVVADPVISADPEKVFETAQSPVVDIGTIVSTRLNAMRKLQANPTDAEALQEMYVAQQQMTSWASSKNKPGQFVGSTGAKILSKHELNLGLQCWAKPEQFLKAEKVKGGFGEFMLKKMGWNDGEGLGKHKSGDVNPLTLDIKFDKKGLMAAEEGPKRPGGSVVTMTACKDLSGKHPISALTELCSKRRWGPPIFTQAFECGPPHKKQYVFKVNVNGQDYQPTVAVDNKKKAKANAAMACLQQMGLVPKDPDNPV
eukprot:GFUD01033535.1.p1 GENE.GFUD01033535.1~~GFUD01033535.1.p1  ORF type:complete len:1145 (+),score=381.41 GFUD01033535.1:62-3496(+)